MKRKLYQAIASRVVAMANCQRSGNTEWFEKHGDAIDALVKEYMPHGSGFDNGTTFDNVRSTARRLVFNTSFHHMHPESGMYDGWSEHSVILTPAFAGYDMRVTGHDRNDIKEYIADTFSQALDIEVEDCF
jgi:hypothetical protein